MLLDNIFEGYPSNWNRYEFSKLFDFEGGLSVSRENLSEEGICYLHYGDIHKTNDNYINVVKDYQSIPKYNERKESINPRYFLKDGDIVFADASEDYEGIGKAITVINEDNIDYINGLHTIVAKDKTDLIVRDYKRYFVSDWSIRKQMMFYATGISVYGISKTNIAKLKVALPSLEEQHKIASILSVWDKAIELKEKLIEQKKEQKKGLMQKLLTGEVRLPGFEGEWETVKISDIASLQGGYAFKSSLFREKGIPIIRISNIYPEITDSNNEFVYYENADIPENFTVNYGDILIAMSGATTGKVGVYKRHEFAYLNQRVGKFVNSNLKKLDYNYLYYLVTSKKFKVQLTEELATGAQPNISGKQIENFKFKIPPLSEQVGISGVLLQIDKWILLQMEELESIKEQKKGLMQNLLTGKVRVKV